MGPESALLEALRDRADKLLGELTSFQEYIRSQGRQKEVDVSLLTSRVRSEVKTLAAIKFNVGSEANASASPWTDGARCTEHRIRSSNLPFYEDVWEVAKNCKGLKALERKVQWTAAPVTGSQRRVEKGSAVVNVVAENGLEWIKVSSKTNKRLLFEIAKEGWSSCHDDEDSDGTATEVSDLEVVRQVKDIVAAAKRTRIRYCHPVVRVVLPNVVEGETRDVDAILAQLRANGAAVECRSPVIPSSGCFAKMLPEPQGDLTSNLNIDCTVLIALVSDISHKSSADLPASQLSGYLRRQIEEEHLQPLLLGELFSVLSGRILVCTADAARRLREIVETMGTDSERVRADILLKEGSCEASESVGLLTALRQHSIHPLPDDLRLPINIHPVDVDHILDQSDALIRSRSSKSPEPVFPQSIARQLCNEGHLSPINKSVFLFGWWGGFTTVTSNRTIAGVIERTLNGILDKEERLATRSSAQDRPNCSSYSLPKMWVCRTARSLIGKEKPPKKSMNPK